MFARSSLLKLRSGPRASIDSGAFFPGVKVSFQANPSGSTHPIGFGAYIQPTRKSDRVFADKLSDLRIILPLEVVVQAACYINVLPQKAKRVLRFACTATLMGALLME